MKKHALILVFTWSALLTAWTLASPPSGTIGTSVRSFFTDATGNIGIRTSAPVTLLDINGTTTIRKSLDMASNKIINVLNPTLSLDAANKAYVDAQVAAASTTITRVWGEGRPNVTVVNTAGECTRTIAGLTAKISRSNHLATWGGTAAACPANWWVCTAADMGAGTCGTAAYNVIQCIPSAITNDELFQSALGWGWLANAGATSNREWGRMYATSTGATDDYQCSLLPAWCCSY